MKYLKSMKSDNLPKDRLIDRVSVDEMCLLMTLGMALKHHERVIRTP